MGRDAENVILAPPTSGDDTAPVTDLALLAAAQQLKSPLRAEREAAEGTLIGAKLEAIPALVGILDQPVEAHEHDPTARVALLLGAMKARDALPAFYRAVSSSKTNKDAIPFIARALGEILDGRDAFDDDARQTLERLSGSTDMFVRAFAADGFGALGDVRSKSRVQALAEDKEGYVRDKARAVLNRLGDAERKAVAGDVSFADFAALAEMATAEGGALKPWLDDLDDARRPVRDAAVVELVKAGKQSVPFLIEKLNQPRARARIGAATAIGRLQPPEAAGPLLIAATTPATTSEERELRPIALRALANCLTGLEEGLAASILPLARDEDRFTRAAALLCLGRLADRKGMKAVVASILEDDPFVVESAAVALSEGVREEEGELVRPLLVALAKRPGPKPAVKEAILIALSRIQIEPPALRIRARHRVRRDVFGQTASTRKAAIVLLERLYAVDDPPPLSLVDDVMTRLFDDHPEVRVIAASFVAKHLEPGFTGAPRLLGKALARRERTLSLLAMDALRRHDTIEAKSVLETACNDSDEVVAGQAKTFLEDYAPSTAMWTFVPKPAVEAPMTRPSVTETQRPRRVRAVDGSRAEGQHDDDDVVEAKDG